MKSENRDSQMEKNLALYSIPVTFVDATPVNDSASLQINQLLNMAMLMSLSQLGNRSPLGRIG